MLQDSWDLRELSLHLGLERRDVCSASRQGVSPGGQQAERGRWPAGLGSNPMPATSWLCDIWGYLLPRHTLCKTCGLTLQISVQDLTVWAGSGGWLDFALSHQLSRLYGARSAKTASHAVRDQGAVSGSLSSSLLGLPHTSGSGSPKGGIPSCQSLLDEGEDVSAISQGEKRLAQCVCVGGAG